MWFRIEQRFDVSVTAVEDTLCDPRFIERMGELPKLGRPQLLDHDATGERVRTRIRYRFVGELSPAVRRVIDPERLTWVEEATMDRRDHRSEFKILPDHYAKLLGCRGTFTLSPDRGEGCRRVAEGTVRVNVPLLGGKVERAIVMGLDEHAQAEIPLVECWVTSSRDREPPAPGAPR